MSRIVYLGKTDDGTMRYTPSGAGVEAGQIVRFDSGIAGVTQAKIEDGKEGVVVVDGIFDVPLDSATTFSEGEKVYWKADTKLAIKAVNATDDQYLGVAVKARAATDISYVRVKINFGRSDSVITVYSYDRTAATLPYANSSGGTIAAGTPVLIGGNIAGITLESIANGESGLAAIEGNAEVPCAAVTVFAVGASVFWDVSAGNVAITAADATGDFCLGVAMEAVDNTTETVKVKLNFGSDAYTVKSE